MPDWKLLRATYALRMFALWKIPLIALVRPKLLEISAQRCVVRVPLTWLTRNHVGSMYFGALSIGADVAGGLIAMNLVKAKGSRATFLFKDVQANFLKRAEGDVVFTCQDGEKLHALLAKAEETGERVDDTVTIVATVPRLLQNEPVAEFQMTISLKQYPQK